MIENHEQKMCKQFIQINTLERTIKDQSLAINEHEAELESLHKKMSELEIRLESQEQYSRRTSLRFHNIKVPVNERGWIIHPVSTDHFFSDNTGIILLRTSGLVRASRTLSVMFFLDTGVFLMVSGSRRSPTEFRRRICRKFCF
jgi:uncharacterized coiled-coil protein SlyX